MIDKVINEVAKNIDKFCENKEKEYTIYTEKFEQGLKKPCFFIYCKNYDDKLFRGKRYKVSVEVCVEFVPEDEKATNKEVNEILQGLYNATDMIDVDGNLINGIDKNVENTKGGILFNVKYEYFYYRQEEKEEMEKLKEKIYF